VTVMPRVALVLAVSFLQGEGVVVSAQGSGGAQRTLTASRTLSFAVPVTSDLKSGDVDEYGLTPVTAGDLVSGTLEVRSLAALVQVVDAGGAVIRTEYFFEDFKPVSRRIGFVAPTAGGYRLQIKGFDRFGGGG
jgi:hypothetical protein